MSWPAWSSRRAGSARTPSCAAWRVRRGRPTRVSDVLSELLDAALAAARATAGAVDPTLGDALAALGYDRDFPEVTEAARRRDGIRVVRRPAPGWQRIELDAAHRVVSVPADIRLDLGATAKAWAADRCARVVADAAGDRRAGLARRRHRHGRPGPDGGWRVLVRDQPDDPAAVVSLPSGGRSRPRAPGRGSGGARAGSCTTSSTRPPACRSSRCGPVSPSPPAPASRPTRGRPRPSCRARARPGLLTRCRDWRPGCSARTDGAPLGAWPAAAEVRAVVPAADGWRSGRPARWLAARRVPPAAALRHGRGALDGPARPGQSTGAGGPETPEPASAASPGWPRRPVG